jgi:hypothetical protein
MRHGTERLFVCALWLIFAAPALATTIEAHDANLHVGQFATVEGVVAEVNTRLNHTTYIDIGGRYPKQAISGVVFARDASKVGDVTGLSGSKIRLSGTIYLFRGYPEIMITSPDQIRTAR